MTTVVVTHRRPDLAQELVESLLSEELLMPESIVVVINGPGGLSDPDAVAGVRLMYLPENIGPAGGFRAGLEEAVAATDARWLYVCEDDVGMFDLPRPHLPRLIQLAEAYRGKRPIGAVVAYGRDLDPRTGATVPHLSGGSPDTLEPVDVAAWGASLISRAVVEAGILPDDRFFFGFEDFEFFLAMQASGFALLVDVGTSQILASRVFGKGRQETQLPHRQPDELEAWRRYYEARNFLELRRRRGSVGLTISHLLKSARRFQIAGSQEHRWAIAAGLRDGLLGRLGKNPRYLRGADSV